MTSSGEKLAEALKLQKDIVTAAAQSDHKTREVLTENTILLFMDSVLNLVHEFFNDGSARAQDRMLEFEHELRGRIVLQEASGQDLAVEHEYFSMVGTIEEPRGDQELIPE